MLDYQRIVDEARNSLFSDGADGADFLRASAADYSVACDQINERLRRCGSLLKQGLRSEAIQLAEIEPNLVDLVATLDFPERPHWNDVLVLNDIVPPQPLMFDVAADLNEAYSIEQPLAELLRQHRLLALSRGPLNQRLDTLRSLAQSDPDNSIWREDVASFEAERLKQLQKEIATAAKGDDLRAIEAGCEELQSAAWLELPPRELLRFAADAHQRLKDKKIRAELAEAVRQLNDSYNAGDVANARGWRDRFKCIAADAGLTRGDSLLQEAAASLAWLADEDERDHVEAKHAAAVDKLQAALQNNASRADLERRLEKAKSFGLPLPADLETGVHCRLAALERRAWRKRATLFGMSSAALLAVVAIAVVFIGQALRRSSIARQSESMERLLATGDLPGAEVFSSQLKQSAPSIWKSDEIQKLEGRRLALVRDERTRHDDFEQALKLARSAGAARPDFVELDKARKLAKTVAEKDDLQHFDGQIKAAANAVLAENTERLKQALNRLDGRVEQINPESADDISTPSSEVAKLRKELQDAGAIQPVDDEQRNRISPLLARLDTIDLVLDRERQEDSQLEQINGKLNDVEAYRQALAAYVQKFPSDRRSVDLRVALQDAPLWSGLSKWNESLNLFAGQNLTNLNFERAAALSAAGSALLKDYDNFPWADALRHRLTYVESVLQRVDSKKQPIIEPLKRLISDPLMSDVWVVEVEAGGKNRVYYLKDKVGLDASGVAVAASYITGFDMSEKRVPGGLSMSTVQKMEPAPQKTLARKLADELAQLSDDNWNQTFYTIVRAILEDKPPVDPILKFNLLKQTLDVACRGSRVLQHAFKAQSDAIESAQIDSTANWLDPTDAGGNRNREKATEFFASLPDLNLSARIVQQERAELQSPLGASLRWVGWLFRDRTGGWHCRFDQTQKQGGELDVVIRPKGGGVAIIAIGKRTPEASDVRLGDGPPLLEGRPVYLKVP